MSRRFFLTILTMMTMAAPAFASQQAGQIAETNSASTVVTAVQNTATVALLNENSQAAGSSAAQARTGSSDPSIFIVISPGYRGVVLDASPLAASLRSSCGNSAALCIGAGFQPCATIRAHCIGPDTRLNLEDVSARLHTTLPFARIETVSPPGLEHIQLGLINADFPTGPLPQEVMHAVIAQPAYWSFCWGSGIALAKRLLEQDLSGQRVADLGCGSGVVGIAAKLAGAKEVWACDNDQDALYATAYNAELNEVQLTLCDDLDRLPNDLDLLLMADVLYDRSNFDLIAAAKKKTAHLIIAEFSGR